MDRKIWQVAAGLGLPGFALIVFYKLYDKLNFSFAGVDPNKIFILAILFMIIVASVVVYAFRLHADAQKHENVLYKYERLKDGLGTPAQNVKIIEEIANSDDPNKKHYMSDFSDSKIASFLEIDVSKEVLKRIAAKKRSGGLYEKCREKELTSILQTVQFVGDEKLAAVLAGLKYWRYVNRRNHPQFKEVEQAIANSMSFKDPSQIVNAYNKINISDFK